ncbi:MAG: ATP-binding protein [Lachnospiraceae bacterium]|nr:ATP-binding protein [Lachnospiraceae bacterium]
MYEAVSVLLEIVSAMFQGYCLQYFYGSFLDGRIWNRRINGLAAAALYGILRLGTGFFLPKGYTSFWVFARLAVILGIVSMIALVFYRAVGKITLFLGVTFIAVSEMSFFLAHMFFELGNHLFRLWDWCWEKGYISVLQCYDFVINITLIGNQILFHIIGAVLLYFTMRKIVRDYREKDYAIHRTELLFILTPGLAGLMVCTLLRITIDTAENGVPELLYDRYPSLIIIVPVILLLLLLSIVSGVKLFQDIICWNREKSSRIILEKQVSSLQEHMGEMERVYSGIRGMKHDMKNTISLIMQLAAGKEEELQAYLEELNQAMDRLEFRFKTGNTVVDTLLNMKYHEITSTVPDLRMDVEGLQFPEKLFIQSYDIGIILGNALDNAMEACRKLKAKEPDAEAFIRISSFQKRELFFLKMENSFDGRLVRRRREEFPMTDKADRENHGIGLANIKSTAEKYQGTMDFKVKGRVFILSVMMKNERREEDGFWSER